MNKLSFLLIFTILGLTINAATFISVQDGSYTDPLTWGDNIGDPTPTSNDDVIISHDVFTTISNKSLALSILSGGSLQIGTTFNSYGLLTVSTGAILDIQNKVFRARNDMILNGEVIGTSGRFYLIENGDLSGTGSWTHMGRVYFNRSMDIVAGSNLSLNAGQLNFGNYTISNFGSFSVFNFRSTSGGTWNNTSNSSLTISGELTVTNINLNASASGNTVSYTRIGDQDQDVITPILGRYYNLTINGDDVESEKNLTGNINILGELNIDGSTFSAGFSSSYDIDIKGNWYNNDGVFNPRQGFVSFNGSGDQELDQANGTESFFDVYFSGDGILSLFADLDVARNITIDKEFDTFGQSINVGGSWTAEDNFNLQGSAVTFDENFSGTITGDIVFDDLTIDKTLTSSVITIAASTTVSVTGTVDVLQGSLNTNDNLLIVSNASGTGRIGDLSNGTITGDVEVQRFFDDSVNGWHLMCAPVQGATLEDWDDDVITTGFVGADYPDFEFNNATFYDEALAGAEKDNGLVDATNSSQGISSLTGWRMYLAAGATTLDVKGPIFSGNQSIPVTYNGDGVPLEDGWNLISNPFVSTIDWDASSGWSKTGLSDAIYIWDPSIEQYTSYVAGIGTNGGTQYVPSTQAFWVQAVTVPSLSIDEGAKVANDVVFRNNETLNNYFKIAIANNQGLQTDVAIRIDERATNLFDVTLDAYFLASTNELIPSVSVFDEDDVAYSIYSIAEFDEDIIIPLNVKVGSAEEFEFTFDNLEIFNKASCLSFVDSETGEVTPLTADLTINKFLDAGNYSDRFAIKLSGPIKANVVNELCADGENKIQVVTPEGTSWNVIGYDDDNTVVFDQVSEEGMITSEFLPAGNYSLEIVSQDGGCANATREVYIPSQNTPDVTFETVNATYGNADGVISTSIVGALPPYQFEWSNGATTENLIDVASGSYSLTVTDSRQCSYSSNVVMLNIGGDTVAEDKLLEHSTINMIKDGDNINVIFNLETKQNYSVNVYNSIGQMMFEDVINGVKVDRISIPGDELQGVVLIVLQNQQTNEKIVQRFVM